MTFSKLSDKQKRVFRWCYNNDYKAVVCDGAVRSGKTVCMITSFILWAMHTFNGASFGICGKTVRSAERNIIQPLQNIADITHYFKLSYTRSVNLLTIEGNGRKNYFYVFGGKDESSYELIQGITLSGIFLDEVALMPRSFVEQATARTLSVENAKYWFNCNPDSSEHWFYKEWILKADEKNVLHLHFTMQDNPILSEKQISDAEKLYCGVFHDRYIKGLWCIAEGLIYPEQARGRNIVKTVERNYTTYYASMDYGTLNPCSIALWGYSDGVWYRIKEYYYSGRETKAQRTDEEYYAELEKLCENIRLKALIIDPSAASFITLVKRKGRFNVIPAKNDVINGIKFTMSCLENQKILINDCCKSVISEFSLYRWNEKSADDRPVKENDHAMDDMRYFCYTVLNQNKATVFDRHRLGIY